MCVGAGSTDGRDLKTNSAHLSSRSKEKKKETKFLITDFVSPSVFVFLSHRGL